jgi:hypothetical protein
VGKGTHRFLDLQIFFAVLNPEKHVQSLEKLKAPWTMIVKDAFS